MMVDDVAPPALPGVLPGRRCDRPLVDLTRERIKRRPILGGVVSEYERVA